MVRRRLLLSMLVLATATVSCATENGATPNGLNTSFAAQMASTWHYVGAPQRVQVGIVASDANGIRVVTQGSADVEFSYLGTDGGGEPEPGPTATASYVPVPGSDASGSVPTIVTGANGVYEAEDVTFDRAGVWRATLSIEIDGVARQLATDFRVDSRVGDPGARDAGAEDGDPHPRHRRTSRRRPSTRWRAVADQIPDPELHEWTIADAIDARTARARALRNTRVLHQPVLRPRGGGAPTPGRRAPGPRGVHPRRDLEEVRRREPGREQGAAEWLLRELPDGTPEMTEPWLFLIGSDGIVADRWGPLFDSAEVAAALEALPPMES